MIERPKGTRDFGPEEMARRRYLEATFATVAKRFGYREVETPTFEHAELFIAKSGPTVVEEMYVFEDKAGRKLALRPELTAPTMRFYLSELQSLPKPLKIYYLGRCYRYDEPQFGRYREFFQFGVEILGANQLAADAEVIATAVDAVREAGLEGFQLRVGHIGLIRGLLPTDGGRQAKILSHLDKRDLEGLRSELEGSGLGHLQDPLLELIGLKGGREILDKAEALVGSSQQATERGSGASAIDHLRELGARLRAYGIEEILYDLGVVRGLDYYTGMVFELHFDPLGSASQICGGGAYSLTEVLGGEPIPTTGFGMGFDRVLLALEKARVEVPLRPLDAFVVPIGDHMREAGYQVLRILRSEGVNADIDLVGRGPSKNLDYAHGIAARYAVLVGEREWKSGKVAVRTMSSGEQREVAVSDLPASVAERPDR